VDLKNFNKHTTDFEFDTVFRNNFSSISTLHWTPLKVARIASEWLCINSKSKILDIGSGVGKFCIVGALKTNGTYTGVEQRSNLVKISNKVIQQNKICKANFINDNFSNINFSEYTAFYLYNPFWENISNDKLIDNNIPVSQAIFQEYNLILSKKLSTLQPGTLVATYLMRETDIPLCYTIVKYDFERNLILWKKI
jgi:hypothetical protein